MSPLMQHGNNFVISKSLTCKACPERQLRYPVKSQSPRLKQLPAVSHRSAPNSGPAARQRWEWERGTRCEDAGVTPLA